MSVWILAVDGKESRQVIRDPQKPDPVQKRIDLSVARTDSFSYISKSVHSFLQCFATDWWRNVASCWHWWLLCCCCSIVSVDKSSESIRLVDDGFGKICNMMNDISVRVRAEAASLLVCVPTLTLLASLLIYLYLPACLCSFTYLPALSIHWFDTINDISYL